MGAARHAPPPPLPAPAAASAPTSRCSSRPPPACPRSSPPPLSKSWWRSPPGDASQWPPPRCCRTPPRMLQAGRGARAQGGAVGVGWRRRGSLGRPLQAPPPRGDRAGLIGPVRGGNQVPGRLCSASHALTCHGRLLGALQPCAEPFLELGHLGQLHIARGAHRQQAGPAHEGLSGGNAQCAAGGARGDCEQLDSGPEQRGLGGRRQARSPSRRGQRHGAGSHWGGLQGRRGAAAGRRRQGKR
jgi:hypothetical protein